MLTLLYISSLTTECLTKPLFFWVHLRMQAGRGIGNAILGNRIPPMFPNVFLSTSVCLRSRHLHKVDLQLRELSLHTAKVEKTSQIFWKSCWDIEQMFPLRPDQPQAVALFPLHSSLSIEEFNNVKWEDINDCNNNCIREEPVLRPKTNRHILRSLRS